jgi:AcrR family transcriptional regulator
MNPIKTITTPQLRADPTRAKILKAARAIFVELGFAGTSIGNIAKKAKINHSLVFHHFGNKEGLWRAVKESIVLEANKLSPILPELTQSFSDFIKKLIIQNISFYRNNPDIVRMINWQRLEYKTKKEIGVTLSSGSKLWLSAFKHYQDNGSINAALKPEFMLTFILSVVSSAAVDPNIFIKKTTDLNEYINFSVESFLKAFKPKSSN